MTEKSKPAASGKPKVEQLELNKETVQELTESDAEAVVGGKPKAPAPKGSGGPLACWTQDNDDYERNSCIKKWCYPPPIHKA
jgi:hypothetical protein